MNQKANKFENAEAQGKVYTSELKEAMDHAKEIARQKEDKKK